LRDRGHEAEHVAEVGRLSADDRTIWERAASADAVLVSKDHDFIEWAIIADDGPQVVWVRIGNTKNASLIGRLEAVWDSVLANLEAGVRIVEAGR
jgi:predicted nuclease of predicted toxin-antitoxin system